jgi:hypothetical protein
MPPHPKQRTNRGTSVQIATLLKFISVGGEIRTGGACRQRSYAFGDEFFSLLDLWLRAIMFSSPQRSGSSSACSQDCRWVADLL